MKVVIGKVIVEDEFNTFVLAKGLHQLTPEIECHPKKLIAPKAKFAMTIIERFALIAGTVLSDDEDSAGRAIVRGKPPAEIVKYAFDIAEETYKEISARDWETEMPELSIWDDDAKNGEGEK